MLLPAMDVPIVDWASLILRWLHITFGVAWIGASFYFNWLNNHIRPVEGGPTPDRVDGELWSVHGGHFYQVVKFKVAPERLPTTLHWFKYEAYFTWITGDAEPILRSDARTIGEAYPWHFVVPFDRLGADASSGGVSTRAEAWNAREAGR